MKDRPENIRQFVKLAKEIYGVNERGYGWQSAMAEDLEVTAQTISNWATGRAPMPVSVEKYLLLKIRSVRRERLTQD